MVHADVELLDAGDERDAVEAALTEKYAAFRTEDTQLPDATARALRGGVGGPPPHARRAPRHLGQQQAAAQVGLTPRRRRCPSAQA